MSCLVIEIIEIRLEFILFVVKFMFGGFDEFVFGLLECCYNVRLYLCVVVVLGLLGVYKYDVDYFV